LTSGAGGELLIVSRFTPFVSMPKRIVTTALPTNTSVYSSAGVPIVFRMIGKGTRS
jgi:hypothetical protein